MPHPVGCGLIIQFLQGIKDSSTVCPGAKWAVGGIFLAQWKQLWKENKMQGGPIKQVILISLQCLGTSNAMRSYISITKVLAMGRCLKITRSGKTTRSISRLAWGQHALLSMQDATTGSHVPSYTIAVLKLERFFVSYTAPMITCFSVSRFTARNKVFPFSYP